MGTRQLSGAVSRLPDRSLTLLSFLSSCIIEQHRRFAHALNMFRETDFVLAYFVTSVWSLPLGENQISPSFACFMRHLRKKAPTA